MLLRFNQSTQDQGDQVSAEVSGSLFDELMSDDDDDSYEETEALDVVLALDSDPLEINQYEATDFESEEPEKVGFIDSSSPELNETISHAPEDITADEIGEPIKDYQKLDFSGVGILLPRFQNLFTKEREQCSHPIAPRWMLI